MKIDAAITTDPRWQQLVRRRAGDDTFVYAVVTTGVFCRPGCAARLPRPENVRFFADAAAAGAAGFRPCQRCRPRAEAVDDDARLVARATAILDDAETTPAVGQLAAALNVSAKRLAKAFKARLELTPKAFIQRRRRQRLQAALADGLAVTQSIFDAGYGASSRFYSEAEAVLGMPARAYRAKGEGRRLAYATTGCALGQLLVAASAEGVAMIALGDDDEALVAQLRERFARAELVHDAVHLGRLLAQVAAATAEPALAAGIPLDIRGTAFQQRVWQALRAIPPGETRTYAEIATAIGSPRATRAVANACAENPAALAVPCHRVVPAAGGIGGYRWGPERKRLLLAREQR